MLHSLIWVALGSAMGGPARFFVSNLVMRRTGGTFPWATLVVNVSGSFLIGLAAGAAITGGQASMPALWPFFVTGFLGAYTTVSAFSLQTMALIHDGRPLRAAGNILVSLFLCLCSVTAGYAAGVAIFVEPAPLSMSGGLLAGF